MDRYRDDDDDDVDRGVTRALVPVVRESKFPVWSDNGDGDDNIGDGPIDVDDVDEKIDADDRLLRVD